MMQQPHEGQTLGVFLLQSGDVTTPRLLKSSAGFRLKLGSSPSLEMKRSQRHGKKQGVARCLLTRIFAHPQGSLERFRGLVSLEMRKCVHFDFFKAIKKDNWIKFFFVRIE